MAADRQTADSRLSIDKSRHRSNLKPIEVVGVALSIKRDLRHRHEAELVSLGIRHHEEPAGFEAADSTSTQGLNPSLEGQEIRRPNVEVHPILDGLRLVHSLEGHSDGPFMAFQPDVGPPSAGNGPPNNCAQKLAMASGSSQSMMMSAISTWASAMTPLRWFGPGKRYLGSKKGRQEWSGTAGPPKSVK